MGAFIQWTDDIGRDFYILFDIITSETHVASTYITEHPVETGADITDHVRVALDEVTIEGYISNAPVFGGTPKRSPNNLANMVSQPVTLSYKSSGLAQVPIPIGSGLVQKATDALGIDTSINHKFNALVWAPENYQDYVQATYQALDGLRNDAQLVSVYCPNILHQNMLVKEFRMNRDKDVGTGANFTVSFKEIRVVQTSQTDSPQPSVKSPGAVSSLSKGGQQVQAETSAVTQASIGVRIGQGFGYLK